jgi:hypothetical protein
VVVTVSPNVPGRLFLPPAELEALRERDAEEREDALRASSGVALAAGAVVGLLGLAVADGAHADAVALRARIREMVY